MIVSVVGVDGCGKSTLIEGVQRTHRHGRAAFMRMSDYANAERLARYRPTEADGVNEWTSGAFGRLRPIATALDFLRFYDDHVLPALEEFDVLYVDRYYPSGLAYGLAMGIDPELMEALYTRVVRPTMTVHVVLPMEEVGGRLLSRGIMQEDENLELLELHDQALRKVAPLQPNYLEISGAAPLHEGPRRVCAAVADLLA